MLERNILFSYLYRDGSNCKQVGSVIFRNPEMLAEEEITERITGSLDGNQWFIADQIGVPEEFLFPRYEVNDNDHCWHEFGHVEPTHSEPTDKRTITEFITVVESAAANGWKVFDPIIRTAERLPAAANAHAQQTEVTC